MFTNKPVSVYWPMLAVALFSYFYEFLNDFTDPLFSAYIFLAATNHFFFY